MLLLEKVMVKQPRVLEKPLNCLSEGKIIIPLKGDAFRVIYFSRLTTKCPYVYQIKDGLFLYYDMDPELDRKLAELESNSKEVE